MGITNWLKKKFRRKKPQKESPFIKYEDIFYPGLGGLEIYGSKSFLEGFKVKAILYYKSNRLIIPEDIAKKEPNDILNFLNSLEKDQWFLFPG